MRNIYYLQYEKFYIKCWLSISEDYRSRGWTRVCMSIDYRPTPNFDEGGLRHVTERYVSEFTPTPLDYRSYFSNDLAEH
ncbi:hypothetical protein J6590_102493 [Homalodisca vitripennis]|nr:hypothetical protein J6590_102493 [Homalodisca vitripennis]